MTEAQRKASDKYIKAQDNITTRYKSGTKWRIQAAANAAGESMNAFIVSAVNERMNKYEIEDMAYCKKIYDDYMKNPDKGEFVSLEEAATMMGVTL